MPDPIRVLRAAIAATTGNAAQFAPLIGVEDRSVYRWLDGTRDISRTSLILCHLLVEDKHLAAKIRKLNV